MPLLNVQWLHGCSHLSQTPISRLEQAHIKLAACTRGTRYAGWIFLPFQFFNHWIGFLFNWNSLQKDDHYQACLADWNRGLILP